MHYLNLLEMHTGCLSCKDFSKTKAQVIQRTTFDVYLTYASVDAVSPLSCTTPDKTHSQIGILAILTDLGTDMATNIYCRPFLDPIFFWSLERRGQTITLSMLNYVCIFFCARLTGRSDYLANPGILFQGLMWSEHHYRREELAERNEEKTVILPVTHLFIFWAIIIVMSMFT